MTCIDCVHYEACDISAVYFGGEKGSKSFREYEKRQNVELDCEQFKDKTRFLNIGDKIYQHDSERIYESTIKNIIYETTGITFDERAIGKTVFLTREEAEKTLERSRDNA